MARLDFSQRWIGKLRMTMLFGSRIYLGDGLCTCNLRILDRAEIGFADATESSAGPDNITLEACGI